MEWWQAAILGVVQGLTEFLPISSTAHMRIVPSLLGWSDPGTAFSAVIQLGTLASVLIYFAGDITRLTAGGLRSLWNAEARKTPEARLAWAIAAGNIPVVVCGLTFRDFIETSARSLFVVGTMLVVVALLLAGADRVARRSGGMMQLRFWQVQLIGICQAVALIPGTSRSGATILGGLLLGLRREDAARFSFLLGIPAILGSGLLQLPPLLEGSASDGWIVLAVALAASLLSGYAAINYLLAFLRRHSTLVFCFYRLLLGGLVLGLAWYDIIR
ncbi:MAG: undecaprenyl-diphosphatase UppP [SAR324 cluster bacterium]|nr:undecaprenyl-diphosphatase UppP [SAR324 cluster bacterium]